MPCFPRSLILSAYQFSRVKSQAASDSDELGVTGLIDCRCPRHDPEVLPVGCCDNHRTVALVEIEDPVVPLGLRGDEDRKPVVEEDLEPGVRPGVHHPGPAADGVFSASGVALVEDGNLARLKKPVSGLGAQTVSLEPSGIRAISYQVPP